MVADPSQHWVGLLYYTASYMTKAKNDSSPAWKQRKTKFLAAANGNVDLPAPAYKKMTGNKSWRINERPYSRRRPYTLYSIRRHTQPVGLPTFNRMYCQPVPISCGRRSRFKWEETASSRRLTSAAEASSGQMRSSNARQRITMSLFTQLYVCRLTAHRLLWRPADSDYNCTVP